MNEIPAKLGQPLKPFIEPIAQFNQLTSSQIEKWVVLSMDSLKAYMDLGLAQARVALKVRNAQNFNEFVDSQSAVLSFVAHRMVEDYRSLNEWGIDCYYQTNHLMRSNLLNLIFK